MELFSIFNKKFIAQKFLHIKNDSKRLEHMYKIFTMTSSD